MIAKQRDAVITELLRRQGIVPLAEICAHCNSSSATARRDLHRLEEQGILRRTHGGAVQIAPAQAWPNGSSHARLAQETRTAFLDRCQVLIVTPTQTAASRLLIQRARRAGIPLIAESIQAEGAATLVAIDDYGAGVELGRWVGCHALEFVEPPVNVLDISSHLPNCQARSRGFADGLRAALPDGRVALRVDGESLRERAFHIAADALAVHDEINVIFGVNDDSALGALDAYRAAGRDDRRLLVVSFGLEGDRSRDALEARGPFKASVAMFPEVVGRACVDAGVCAHHGCALPEHLVTPHALVTADTLPRYYRRDHRTGKWVINWASVAQLPGSNPDFASLGECRDSRRPAYLGHVVVFGEHDWYRNMQRAIREHSRELGIHLDGIDASKDADREIDTLKRAIGRAAARYVRPGDTIILDGGVTTAYLAQELHGLQGVTVITNSVPVLAELANEPGIVLVSCGGTVRSQSQTLVGPAAEAAFENLRADKAFIAGTGVSLDFGLSNTSIPEAGVKLAILRAAREVILLADHTKIGVESLVKVAPIGTIHRIVTDAGIGPHHRLALAQLGVEVMIADE